MHAVLQHLGQLAQEPLLGPLQYILQNYPKLLLQASYTRCAPGGAAELFAQIQYQMQQASAAYLLLKLDTKYNQSVQQICSPISSFKHNRSKQQLSSLRSSTK